MRDILLEAELLDQTGARQLRTAEQLAMGYRHCALPEGWIFTAGRFRLTPDDPERVRERMRQCNRKRRASQPLEWPSAGSVFKNPPEGPKAWEWIQQAGLRGLRVGDAQVSTRHCNFFVNLGQATATEMRTLMDRVQEEIKRHFGVELQPEVQCVGWD
ncbi:MAG: hypothetical protein HQM00_17270 [Magnetococcales bacterium]|nr:hypothetical protein [Magnetococcales bacterium]